MRHVALPIFVTKTLHGSGRQDIHRTSERLWGDFKNASFSLVDARNSVKKFCSVLLFRSSSFTSRPCPWRQKTAYIAAGWQ